MTNYQTALEALHYSEEAFLTYDMFFKQKGIRRTNQLFNPKTHDYSVFQLPRGSILHYDPRDASLISIDSQDPLLNEQRKLIQVEYVLELTHRIGNPRPTRMQVFQLIRDHHRKHRRLRWCKNLNQYINDPNTLIVESYGALPHLWRFPPLQMAVYNQWVSFQGTLWDRIAELSKITDRQHFIVVNVPKTIPRRETLQLAAKGITRPLLKRLNSHELLFWFEVWKWLGEERSESILMRAKDALKRVNLIVNHDGQWTVLNLGVLDSWREGSDEPGMKIAPRILQRRLLGFLHMLSNGTTLSETLQTDENVQSDSAQTDTQPKPVASPSDPQETPAEAETVTATQTTQPESVPDDDYEEVLTDEERLDEQLDQLLNELDAADQELDDTEARQMEEAETTQSFNDGELLDERREAPPTVIQYTQHSSDPKAAFLQKADVFADQGFLTAAEYRRLTMIAGSYERLKNPYGGDQPIAQAMQVEPKQLEMEAQTKLPPVKGLVDTSMQNSSVKEFTRKYVEEVLHKDILRCVVGVQNGGVALTGYQVTPVEDAMGSYEDHSVQYTPIMGKPVTLKFRIPKVFPDGRMVVGGNRIYASNTRRDHPLRKVSPSKVAMTSYYSKVFIHRSEKQSSNYTDWLNNQIASQAVDPQNTDVTNPSLIAVFNQEWRVPRLYSILSMRFKSVTIRDIDFFLDYDHRETHFGADRVKRAEQSGNTVIGQKGKQLVTVDQHDQLHLEDGTFVGTIDQIVRLKGRTPLEYSDVRIMGKAIPVGIALGYLMGFERLIQLLGVKPRVDMTDRPQIAEDEFALRFSDQTLVFPRYNRLVSLIMGGWTLLEKVLHNYNLHQFNTRDVYLTALHQSRIGLRYLRELESLNDLWLDPITEEILKELKEPTQFTELLVRASELLITDWSPQETDLRYQRICGYERIAGHIYTELSKAVRLYRARGMGKHTKLEMPPFQVYQAITTDTSMRHVESCNPIHNLKENESVTFGGTGGRSGRSMTERTRVYHESDLGTISEATKDSKEVAISTFMTADPKLKNLRGMTEAVDFDKDGPSKLVSTSSLLLPGMDHDDEI